MLRGPLGASRQPALVARRCIGATSSPVIAQLSSGALRGEAAGGIAFFGGIPFATPPVGQRRWRRPESVSPWRGVLDCTRRRRERRFWPVQGGVALQRPPLRGVAWLAATISCLPGALRRVLTGRDRRRGRDIEFASEDCLYLDAWVPIRSLPRGQGSDRVDSVSDAVDADCRVPVILWLYGGGLLGGCKDGGGQSGRAYAERGILFVRCNYRVGALGFLVPEGGDANCGMWDQVAALRWIQKEAWALGGDPTNVTVMGESAGADSVYWLCCSPVANRLFKRAIMQSPGSFTITRAQARDLAAEFASVSGALSESLEDMQALSAEAVLKTQTDGHFSIYPTTSPGWREFMLGRSLHEVDPSPLPTSAGLFRFPPDEDFVGWPLPVAVIDGELLLERPLDALARGTASHLEIIIGANRDEDAFDSENGGFGKMVLDWDMLGMPDHVRQALRRDFVGSISWEIAGAPKVAQAQPDELRRCVEQLLKAYEEERLEDNRSVGPCGQAASAAQWLQDSLLTDFGFLAMTLLIAERLARPGGAAGVFRYQFEGYSGNGAIHAAELELMLGEDSDIRRGSLEVRQEWLDSWAAFAHTGDPNTPNMAGAWRLHSEVSRPVLLWDGIESWRADGGVALSRRRGLFATARLWEELWELERVALQERSTPIWLGALDFILPARLW